MPTFWRYTMYYITPFTYWIGGILSSTLHNQPVVCNAKDLSFFNPPPGIMCGVYAESWLQTVAGYIVNPDAPDLCGYCQYDVADDVSLLSCVMGWAWGCMGADDWAVSRVHKFGRFESVAIPWNFHRLCDLECPAGFYIRMVVLVEVYEQEGGPSLGIFLYCLRDTIIYNLSIPNYF
jgi:hypothetical protein